MDEIQDRAMTQEFSPEFLREMVTFEDYDDLEEILDAATRRFEQTYNAVAWVEVNKEFYAGDRGYRIRVIPTRSADRDEIKRGIQSLHYWISDD